MKIARSIRIMCLYMCLIRHFLKALFSMYHAVITLYLSHHDEFWGNSYKSDLHSDLHNTCYLDHTNYF